MNEYNFTWMSLCTVGNSTRMFALAVSISHPVRKCPAAAVCGRPVADSHSPRCPLRRIAPARMHHNTGRRIARTVRSTCVVRSTSKPSCHNTHTRIVGWGWANRTVRISWRRRVGDGTADIGGAHPRPGQIGCGTPASGTTCPRRHNHGTWFRVAALICTRDNASLGCTAAVCSTASPRVPRTHLHARHSGAGLFGSTHGTSPWRSDIPRGCTASTPFHDFAS